MDISKMMDAIRQHPEFDKVGMVLCHNGTVRGTSRDGRKVKGLCVSVDHRKLDLIVSEQKKRNTLNKNECFIRAPPWPRASSLIKKETLKKRISNVEVRYSVYFIKND